MKAVVVTFVIFANQIAFAHIPDREKEVNWQQAFAVASPNTVQTLINKYVPLNLTPTQNGQALSREFAEKTTNKINQKVTQDFLNGEFFKDSFAGKTMKQVQDFANTLSLSNTKKAEGLTQETKATAASNSLPAKPIVNVKKNQIEHIFKLDFRVVERVARFNYSGYFESQVVYSMDNSTANVSLSKPINTDTSLSLVGQTSLYQINFNPTLTLTHAF